jgi:hypothetical protein
MLVIADNGREITHTGLCGRRRSSYPEQSGGDEDEANARLIAAAPDLLAACEMACAVMSTEGENDIEEWEKALQSIEAAIAKATGK